MSVKILKTLPPQLFHEFITPRKFRRVKRQDCPQVKPDFSGLWTSTYNPETRSSGWLDWCKTEMETRLPKYRHAYIYQPASGLKIIEIDSLADLVELNEKYGRNQRDYWKDKLPYPDMFDKRYPDWLRLAQTFDGVHLTERGQWDTRLPPSRHDDLYGWDCESTLWLRLRPIDEANAAMKELEQHEVSAETKLDGPMDLGSPRTG